MPRRLILLHFYEHSVNWSQSLQNEVYEIIVRDPLDPRFAESSRNEIKDLLEVGPYVAVRKEEIPNGATISKYRDQYSIKTNPDGTEKLKARLVIQGHKNPYKEIYVKEAPTILRSSIPIIFTFSAIPRYKIWSGDVNLAFVQSDSPLCSDS